jgi:cytochrome P450
MLTGNPRLPLLPVELAAFSANPDPYLDVARRVHPWLARFSQGYIVHGCQAVADLLADEHNLLSGFGPVVDFYGLRDSMWGRFMTELIMARSGPDHKRLRHSIFNAFTPRRANEARDMIRSLVSDLLDEQAPQGVLDFAQLASNIPVAVVFGLLGAPVDGVSRIRHALENQLLSVTLDQAAKPLFLAGWDTLWNFAESMIRERRQRGELHDDSLLDVLIIANDAGELDDIELRFMLLTMVIGGYDTTKNQFTMTMKLLVERPALYARCADDLQLCGKVVVESLRHSATVSPFRAVADDFTYRDVRFLKGETLVLATPLAGRDPIMFSQPDEFDPERSNANRHVGFGRGSHICPGQFLAKNLMQVAMHEICQRMRHPQIVGEIEWRSILGSWGPKQLMIAYDAA